MICLEGSLWGVAGNLQRAMKVRWTRGPKWSVVIPVRVVGVGSHGGDMANVPVLTKRDRQGLPNR